ncbi:N-acetylserine-responsive cysteine regulon transcriptional activator [Gammaproteobacteria bacterium]|nr:N-acetylserine-responsive cysteine regulon transcriptional activator [Gammaproteobacteria bacterium]
MKLQQLRFLVAVAKNDLNISSAAEILYTSQPGISKQIRMLEDELGVQIFARAGKQLTKITPAGEKILVMAENMLRIAENMKAVGAEYKGKSKGSLHIATTHTQARYALPMVIKSFKEIYPDVSLHIHQGSPAQIAELVSSGAVDFAISTEHPQLFEDLILMPCYLWNRSALVPKDHPLAQLKQISLNDIAAYPLVTYVFAFGDSSPIYQAFHKADLSPKVAFSATDADVIKEYIRLGLGVGILASMAYVKDDEADLVAISLEHLFDWSTTYISIRPEVVLRKYTYDFIKLFANHLDVKLINMAEDLKSSHAIANLFADIKLPRR